MEDQTAGIIHVINIGLLLYIRERDDNGFCLIVFIESFRSNFIVLFGDGKVSRLQYEGVGHPFPIYLPEGDFPVAIDYDEFGHKLYWIDGRAKVAKRSNLNGTDVQILRSLPEGIVV